MVASIRSAISTPGSPTIRNISCQPWITPNGTWIGGVFRNAASTKKLIRVVIAGPATDPICRMAIARGIFSRGNRSETME